MATRSELRQAHEIVDKIDSVYEREKLRGLLPPRPGLTFRETLDEMKALLSEDDIRMWKLISSLEKYNDIPVRYPENADEYRDAPEGTLVAKDGGSEVWTKIQGGDWDTPGVPIRLDSEGMGRVGFRVLRWGWGND